MKPKQVYVRDFSDPSPRALLFALIILTIIGLYALKQASDRFCDKPFGPEFRASDKYKELQCPK
jgi:hypothetical protein